MACDDINHSWTCGGNHDPLTTRAAEPAPERTPRASDLMDLDSLTRLVDEDIFKIGIIWANRVTHLIGRLRIAEAAALRTAQLDKMLTIEIRRAETAESALVDAKKLTIQECITIAQERNRGHRGNDCGHAVEIINALRVAAEPPKPNLKEKIAEPEVKNGQ